MNNIKTLLAAFLFAGCAYAANNAETIKVGTCNIRNQRGDAGTPNAWDLRKADLANSLRKQDMDAFGLQEVYRKQADYIYVSDGIKVKNYGVVNDPRPGTEFYISDHFLVNAVIEL